MFEEVWRLVVGGIDQLEGHSYSVVHTGVWRLTPAEGGSVGKRTLSIAFVVALVKSAVMVVDDLELRPTCNDA